MTHEASKQRFRQELKILFPTASMESFVQELSPFCTWDEHVGPTHCYEVASLYYDTRDLRFHFVREESVGYRRKIRLRAYVTDGKATTLFVEIKEKHKQLCSKKRVNLKNLEILSTHPQHHRIPLDAVIAVMEDGPEKREVEYLHRRLKLYPVVIVRYVRYPLIPLHESDMRITIDTRLTCGGESLSVYEKDRERFLINPSTAILEIKTNSNVPLWLQSALRRYGLRQEKYSKYCESVNKWYGRAHNFIPMEEDLPLLRVEDHLLTPAQVATG
jgi:SPX domain protein involved in polyphosphate accumulation